MHEDKPTALGPRKSLADNEKSTLNRLLSARQDIVQLKVCLCSCVHVFFIDVFVVVGACLAHFGAVV